MKNTSFLFLLLFSLATFSCGKDKNDEPEQVPFPKPMIIGIADTSVQYVDMADIVFIGDPANYSYDDYMLDMNGDNINDFVLTLATGHVLGTGATYGKSWVDSIGSNKVSCGFFHAGDTLDKNIAWCGDIDLTNCGDDRYIALRVVNPDTTYGWVKVSAEYYSSLTIQEYAWFLK
jgi:hypothetical protein